MENPKALDIFLQDSKRYASQLYLMTEAQKRRALKIEYLKDFTTFSYEELEAMTDEQLHELDAGLHEYYGSDM